MDGKRGARMAFRSLPLGDASVNMRTTYCVTCPSRSGWFMIRVFAGCN